MGVEDQRLDRAENYLDPRKLRHFLYVYETRNFARAADLSHVTQQAVSKSIARLEDLIGVVLFERGAYGAAPTIYADALARRARIILSENRLASAEINALKGAESGGVRVGFGWSFLPRVAPLAISNFRKRRPGITLSISTGDSNSLFGKLLSGDLEFVASAPPPAISIDPQLQTRKLFEETDVIVMRAGHPLAKKRKLDLAELSRQTWLMSFALSAQWQAIAKVFIDEGVNPPANLIDVDSVLLAKSMIMQSDCIASLSRELVAAEVSRREFVIHEVSEFPSRRPAFLTTRKGAVHQPAAKAFIRDLSRACSEIEFH